MKTLTKSLLTLVGLTLLPLSTNAADTSSTSPDYQLPVYKVEDMTLPVPTKIVSPRISMEQVGSEVEIIFTVTDQGRAIKIHARNNTSRTRDLAAAMSAVIKHWEFEPAKDKNGLPRAVKVALPVRVVRAERSGQGASLALVTPSILSLAN